MQVAIKVESCKESDFTAALYGRGEIKRLFWVVNKTATGTYGENGTPQSRGTSTFPFGSLSL